MSRRLTLLILSTSLLLASTNAFAACRMKNSLFGLGNKILLEIDRETAFLGVPPVVEKFTCSVVESQPYLGCSPSGILGAFEENLPMYLFLDPNDDTTATLQYDYKAYDDSYFINRNNYRIARGSMTCTR